MIPGHQVNQVDKMNQVNSPTAEDVNPLPQRHCGRCQRGFEGDPGLFFQTDWALCPECTKILLPAKHTSARLSQGA